MYKEVTSNLRKRGNIVHIKDLPNYVNSAISNKEPLYVSYYEYPKEILDYINEKKTIRRYDGAVCLNNIKFDIDKGLNTEEFTLKKARVFYEKLIEEWKIPPTSIQIYFSGRGFHFVIPNIFNFKCSNTLNTEVKATLSKYFPESDIIYDKTRLFRAPNTLNEKSRLYKIPITEEELYGTMENIKKIAENPRLNFALDYKPIEPKYEGLIIKSLPNTEKKQNEFVSSNIAVCMQKLYARGAIEGRRHQDLLRLVSTWKRQGLNLQASQTLARNWASSLEPTEINRLVEDIYTKNYVYGCNDRVFHEYCDPSCMFYTHKNFIVQIKELNSIEKDYIKFLQSDLKERKVNISTIHPSANLEIVPGELVLLTADSGIGKSAFVQNLVYAWGKPTLYFSLEMHEMLTYRRFIQIAHKMTKEEVELHYQSSNPISLVDKINHVKIVSSAPSLQEIEKIINQHNPNIVVIDVIDVLQSKAKDINSKLVEIINFLNDLAKRHSIIVIGIHHLNKTAGMEARYEEKISMHGLKGVSDLYQKSDQVLALLGSPETNFRKLVSLKTRDENPIKVFFQWETKTFVFYPITK